jgi:hypothetical protein
MVNAANTFFSSYKETKTIKELSAIDNIKFSPNGQLFSYTIEDTLKIYSANDKYAIRNVITANIKTMEYFQDNTVLHTKDHAIYYLSIHDNKYLRKFESHNGAISSISTDRINDQFMSVGSDCINIWDIRMEDPIKRINTNKHIGCLGTDKEYALADNNFIKIYDKREDYGPIATKTIPSNFYKKIWYTPDNNYISLSTLCDYTFLDGSGSVVSFVSLEKPNDGETTQDCSHLVCCSGRYIFAYRISDRMKMGVIDTPGYDNYQIRCNPMYPQFLACNKEEIRIWASA